MNFEATLLRGGRGVLAGLVGSIRRAADGSGGWSGDFVAPAGTYLGRGVYQLELSDGRAGDVLIPAVGSGGLVAFAGVGPLAPGP